VLIGGCVLPLVTLALIHALQAFLLCTWCAGPTGAVLHCLVCAGLQLCASVDEPWQVS
jgi:hypothetical protein